MQKKKIILLTILIIILAIIILLITISSTLIKKQNLNQIALENSEIEDKPNMPTISSGMIPVKKNGANWVETTKDDPNWYDYDAGTPAYIKLNDNSIYMWIPRFAYDGETVKYLPEEKQIGGNWVVPEMFTYAIENEKMPDYSLAGVWVEIDENTDYTNTINEMNKENSTYGFIANTKPRQITESDTVAVAKFVVAGLKSALTNSTNCIILQIINTNKVEPIKAKIAYNKVQQRIEVTVTYTKNGIAKIVAENSEELILKVENGLTTTNTGDLELENKEYIFSVEDNFGNKKELKIKLMIEIKAENVTANMYGSEVKGYKCSSGGVSKWRIFYADKQNIYLISDYYLRNTYLPETSSDATVPGVELNKKSTYQAFFTNILDYCYVAGESNDSGSEWIRNNTKSYNIVKKWLLWLSNKSENKYNNVKAIAYMLDTLAWSNFAGEKAEYAIGGPTMDMFCASYEATHPERYISCRGGNVYGMSIYWYGSTSEKMLYFTDNVEEYNGIYTVGKATTSSDASGYWLIAPSADGADKLVVATRAGCLNSTVSYKSSSYAFRPVVCLKSDVKLTEVSDGIFEIQ